MPGPTRPGAAPGAPPAAPATGEAEQPARRHHPAATGPAERGRRAAPGTIEGKVKVPGGDTSDLYVYVENYRGPMARGRAVEIKQENKQFIPRVAVVPVGTSVTFPNLDPIFHNVFSNSPRNTLRPGQLPGRRQDPGGGVQLARAWWTSTATCTSA